MMDQGSHRILITGGAGYLGRHLARDLIERGISDHVRIFSRDEHKHEEMRNWAEHVGLPPEALRYIIGDVCDTDLLKWAIRGIDCVIHAAALKIVPAMQYNPIKAIDVNLNGWMSVVKAVLDNNNPIKVVGVSTDKACEPINTYGKAKALGEDLFTHANVYSPKMKFSCVRYGNVIGSTSSLVALLEGGTENAYLTHEDMTRFFMPIGGAVDLVESAMCSMHGAEIFVPPCRSALIKDVLAVLTGREEFEVTGIRPGEKLHEVLINEYEAMRSARHRNGNYFIGPEMWPYEQPNEYVYYQRDDPARALRSNDPELLLDREGIRRLFDVDR